jgi:hypothetical protein
MSGGRGVQYVLLCPIMPSLTLINVGDIFCPMWGYRQRHVRSTTSVLLCLGQAEASCTHRWKDKDRTSSCQTESLW